IIRFEDFIDSEKINEILAELNFEKIDQIPELNSILVKIPDIAVERAIDLSEEIQGIRYAEPNQKVQTLNAYNYNGFEDSLSIPDDPYYYEQWHYPLIRLPQAWASYNSSSSEPIRIAVLDTGIDGDHEDLENHIDENDGINVINHEDDSNSNDFYDDNGHGTHVAGTIGAINNNDTGVSGILQNIEIIPIKALDSKGNGFISDIVKGISYAAGLADSSISEKVDIINMSFGINSSSSSLEDVLEKAYQNNVILVSASGNDGNDLLYPAAYPEVISVGSVSLNSNNTPERSDFSNYGSESSPELDFVAPGDNLLSSSPDDNYGTRTGTSMAAPHVAGLIGLMFSQEPELTDQEIRERLARTGMKINDDNSYHDDETGYGLINAYWALNDVQEIKVLLGKEGILKNDNNSTQIDKNKIITEKTIPLEEFYDLEEYNFDFIFNGIEPGNYRLIGLIDVNNNSSNDDYIIIEPGDYFSTEILLEFQPDEHYEFKIELQEYEGNLN
ncbi:MAG: S8 family serine peptidase, partial [Halarsenatibacteraceae bacterium]